MSSSSSTDSKIYSLGYERSEKLGSGSYSKVYQAHDKAKNVDVAIKCIDKSAISKSRAENIIREIEILKMLHHPHIVEMLDFHWDDRYVYIVLEYCNGGDLSKYIKRHNKIPESICKKFMYQLITGLQYLRKKGIYHYDLKPQNILLQKGPQMNLKITDFGLSLFADRQSIGNELKGPRGSPSYMAPELLLCDTYDSSLIDMWSLGVILYECLHGKLPLPQRNVKDLMVAMKANTPIKVNVSLSPDCKSLLGLLLSYNPKARITFEQMLKHPFINLEYSPPTEETFRKAINLKREAVKLDYELDHLRAFSKYCEALKYMVPIVTKIVNGEGSIEGEVEGECQTEELSQGEVLDDELASASGTDSEGNVYFKAQSHLTTKQVTRLKTMAKATPKMFDSLDVGYTAQMYLCEGNYEEALKKFMLSLSVLVPLLSREPCGLRRELLKIQIKEFLKQAEGIKTLLKANSDISRFGYLLESKDEENSGEGEDDMCRIS